MSTVPDCKTGRTGITTREVPGFEDGKDIKAGTVVFEYEGYTYGCVRDSGVTVCLEPNSYPFLEIPCDAVIWE